MFVVARVGPGGAIGADRQQGGQADEAGARVPEASAGADAGRKGRAHDVGWLGEVLPWAPTPVN